ncbi:flagellin [Shimia marina]|uniref:Flagellin n=1 Tax=Shimia marina TaxID=321267 RepID=A0A0P1ELP4_9RHOB|nr:flagellin [Shimia marina]CUH51371.1 Flagellin [Shimia marina]SFD50795.1 flagellin [Shimia marina]
MTSLLTNNGAMVALQTLKSVNASLSETQGMISTGKKVDNAKQNAAVWAISKTMESDVSGFKAISESLSLGESTVAVARQATETVNDLLGQIKDRVISATGDNVDRDKLQSEVVELRNQIGSVVGAAQFNGLNLVDGSVTQTNVLSSLDRDASGTVTASNITVAAQSLTRTGYVANDIFAAGATTAGTNISAAEDQFSLSLAEGGGTNDILLQDGTNAWAAGDTITLAIGDQSASYTLQAGDLVANTIDMVATGLKSAIDELGIANFEVTYDPAAAGQLSFENNSTEALSISGSYQNAAAGGLAGLDTIDISSGSGATSALSAIEGMIQNTIDAGAAFGTVENRISTQNDFVSKLTDSMKSGIGSLVDADMEETSARLQALQVQQQLATQSLSIANQGPQQLLSLFR